MATSNHPFAPDATTDIDGPEVWPPLEPEKDLGEGAKAKPDPKEEAVDRDDPL